MFNLRNKLTNVDNQIFNIKRCLKILLYDIVYKELYKLNVELLFYREMETINHIK